MLKYHSTKDGFCEVVYRGRIKPGSRIKFYCLQKCGIEVPYRFLECSRDKEPSHQVNIDLSTLPLPPGDTKTEQEVREFLAEAHKYHFESGHWRAV